MIKTAYQLSSKKKLAANADLFSEKDLAESYITEFSSNQYIHKEGEELDFLFYILQGKAKILKNEENGKAVLIQFVKAGDIIGDLTLLEAETMTKDVVSIGSTVCLAIPIRYARTVLLNRNSFLRKISKYMGEKLLLRMDHFAANQTYELKYRLAELLLEVSVDDVYKEKHTEIAEYLGVSYRHLLHTLKQFREQGLIEKQNSVYVIDRKGLEEYLSL
ncbi:transcriptional regulator YeiL [Enterococcus sp. LJL128]|uniref:transcriptional regulator YeiL n=1 Tax=Enterococcus sp. LJL51 TaxID=3416656 RepID=UPI003CE8F129